jgi:hypothetical protein
MVATGSDSTQESGIDESVGQLVIDQLEELVVTVVEEIRERPTVAMAIVAGIVGALVGVRFADTLGGRRKSSIQAQPVHTMRGSGSTAQLVGLGMRLLQNPIVRTLLLGILEREFRRRMAR